MDAKQIMALVMAVVADMIKAGTTISGYMVARECEVRAPGHKFSGRAMHKLLVDYMPTASVDYVPCRDHNGHKVWMPADTVNDDTAPQQPAQQPVGPDMGEPDGTINSGIAATISTIVARATAATEARNAVFAPYSPPWRA